MTGKKKLIEVALPLEAINRESVRENYIYRGNPSAVHKWWAQRPLAACRAVLFASLVDDPGAHPERFPTEEAQETERQRLFKIIEDLVTWENGTNERVLEAARAEIRGSCDGELPTVFDPFCGAGSIPLEAQRLGLDAIGSDLNPVAVLISKALIEIPPKFTGQAPIHPEDGRLDSTGTSRGARALAEDVRYYGNWMLEEAQRRIGELYPMVALPPEHGGGMATVIAWIWARTVKSPNPAWDGLMPLVRSFALSTKKGRETWARPVVDRRAKTIHFEIKHEPGDHLAGTVGRAGAKCLATGVPVPLSYIRDEGVAGRMGAQLMAMVAEGPRGRIYLPADADAERIAHSAVPPADVPDFQLSTHPQYMSPPRYGLTRLRDLFTDRQLVAVCALSDLVREARQRVVSDGGTEAYGDAVAMYLAFAVDKYAEYGCSLVPWYAKEDRPKGVFARQALPMVWDFAEVNPLCDIGGSWITSVGIVAGAIEGIVPHAEGVARQRDAASIEREGRQMVCTDPPYYDNVPYADLSDFFYVWLRRTLKDAFPMEFSTLLVPKRQELVADVQRYGSRDAAREHFESGMVSVFHRIHDIQDDDFPITVFYAFRQAEESDGVGSLASTGWETMLEGLVRAGLSVLGTWPMRSERAGRMRDVGSNALASSIVLVCRPRAQTAALATRKELLTALKSELPSALRKLQQGNIAPVDLAQAAIGPGMAVFSRYARVVEADGTTMTVRTALSLINQVLDETLSEQEGDFDTDTRWALAWFEEAGMSPGRYGKAETLSKAKNTSIPGLVQAGLLESRAGNVRLLDRDELPAAWDPATDTRLTVWEVTQHLIRALQTGGEAKAGELLRLVGGLGDTARELAYRLYTICERKKWPQEALAYNGLVVAWPEIVRLASTRPMASIQEELV